ncbi:tetratricopeptide repeat protein [bacterium]|nr:tetratricopeptide repeat protein [bacterium]
MRTEGRRRAGAASPAIAAALCMAALLSAASSAFGQAPARVAQAQPAAPKPPSAGTAPAAPAAQPSDAYQKAAQAYQYGRQLQSGGKEADAAKAFNSSLAAVEKLLAAEPGNADYLSLQCWNLFRLGRHKDVVAAAQKALRTVKDFRIMETLAESLYFLERSDEALKYFASYFELAPPGEERMSSAYYYVGECYMRLKKYEHADIAFSTATAMEQGMYYWWYRLGVAKENLGQYKRAYEMYGKALALSPAFKFAKEGQERVKAKSGL